MDSMNEGHFPYDGHAVSPEEYFYDYGGLDETSQADLLGPVFIDLIAMQDEQENGLFIPEPDSTGTAGNNETTHDSSPTGPLPSFEDYPGPLDFCVEVSHVGCDKSNGVYSEALKKLFITMGKKIPFNFRWNECSNNLNLRALLVFLNEDSLTLPVTRCPTHYSDMETSNVGFFHVHHVMRCDDKRTIYDKNEETGRLSVVVPLDRPQPGTNWTSIMFMFMCKNSCVLGMNRRPTGIIFTLETEDGKVVGRKTMKLRVCSCPKRDAKKEEENFCRVKTESEEPAEAEDSSTVPDKWNAPVGKKMMGKKPLKRLSTKDTHDIVYLTVPVPRIYRSKVLQQIRDVVSWPEAYRELNEAEKKTVEACNKMLE